MECLTASKLEIETVVIFGLFSCRNAAYLRVKSKTTESVYKKEWKVSTATRVIIFNYPNPLFK